MERIQELKEGRSRKNW